MVVNSKIKGKNVNFKISGNYIILDITEISDKIKLAQMGDIEALQDVYSSQIPLIIRVVNGFEGNIKDIEEWKDIFSACIEKLIELVYSFNPDKKISFSQFLRHCLKNLIITYFRDRKSCETVEGFDAVEDKEDSETAYYLFMICIQAYLKSLKKWTVVDNFIQAIYNRIYIFDTLKDIKQDILLDDAFPYSTQVKRNFTNKAIKKMNEIWKNSSIIK